MLTSKKFCLASWLGIAIFLHEPAVSHAEFLYNAFITPAAGLSVDRASWDVFYSPLNGANYPDFRGTGTKTTASAAGVIAPANSRPTDPSAFFDARNPTITQTANVGAFITDPGVAGNIYSFAGPTAYRVNNTTTTYASPYNIGTVSFQFQTAGTELDYSSFQLQYTDTSNVQHSLVPTEFLREYRGDSGSSFGGLSNRSALQWDLHGLGIQTYQIVFNATGSSNSFQLATMATSAAYGDIVPASRIWSTSGTGSWSNGFGDRLGSTGLGANTNGNVRFSNTAAAITNLDQNYIIGEVRFETPANANINTSNGSTLTANTGITTTAAATGTYTVNANYALGAYNVFDVAAGEVVVNGVISGAYGLEKAGAGTVTLAGNNTFTGPLSVGGGTLRVNGVNAYSGATTVLQGTMILGGDAPNGTPGALGNASTSVGIGADSAVFTFPGETPSATLQVNGNSNVGRSITFASGTYEKRVVATNTTPVTGATFSGSVDLGTATDVKFTATAATDRLNFTGPITGGVANGAVTINGAGTVVYSGIAAKNYASATNVNSGTLQVASGATFSLTGAVSIANGATLAVNGAFVANNTLAVNGALNGTGILTLASGSTLTGTGTVSRPFTVGTGATLSPGNSVGALNTASQTWASGGIYHFELSSTVGGAGNNPGNDVVRIAGNLTLSATAANPFKLQLQTLTVGGTAGSLADFNQNAAYSWQIASVTGTITGFDASAFQVDTTGFANGLTGTFAVSANASSILLNYTPVPEPSTVCLLIGGVIATGIMLRRLRTVC